MTGKKRYGLFNTISGRLALSFIVLSILIVGVSFISTYLLFSSNLREYLMQNPLNIAESVEKEVSRMYEKGIEPDEILRRIETLSTRYGAEVMLYDRSGKLIASSSGGDSQSSGMGWCSGPMAQRNSRTMTTPVYSHGEVVAFVGIVLTRNTSFLGAVDNFKRSATISFGVSGLMVILLAMFSSWILTRYLSEPIMRAVKGSEKLAAGDYNICLDERGNSEIG